MNVLPEEFRYEWKIPMDRWSSEDLVAWLHGDGLEFRKAYADRLVQSIYFDTVDLRSYASNLNGDSERTKVRLRWYGESIKPERCRFEVKYKRNRVGCKLVEDLPRPSHLPEGLDRLAPQLRESIAPKMRLYLDGAPRPVMWNRYHRAYYSTIDGVRLTVDTDMQSAQLLTGHVDRARWCRSPVVCVVEIKCPVAQAARARSCVASLPGHVGKHSKFVLGIGAALS